MKYSDLVKVLTIYKAHSFTAAAKQLYMTQPAISQNIAQLEKELNVLLFVRDNGIVVPTPACDTFIDYATRICDLWQGLEKEMQSYNPDNVLHIGTTSFFFRFLSYKAEALFAQHPVNFRYTIVEDTASNIERQTLEGKLNFCFTRAPLQQAKLKSEAFFTEEILFALPSDHPVCNKYPATEQNPYPIIDLSDFQFSNFVMVNNPRITPLCHQLCENAGYRPQISMCPVSWEHVIMGIRTGRGVGFFSNLHIKRGEHTDLRFFRIDSPLAKMEHIVAYRSSYELSKDARFFISSFRKFVQGNLESFQIH